MEVSINMIWNHLHLLKHKKVAEGIWTAQSQKCKSENENVNANDIH